MTEEEKRCSETFRIEISHFMPNSPESKFNTYNTCSTEDLLSKRESEFNSNNTMKISIERKNQSNNANVTTIVNLNNEEALIGEKIQIKIENSKKGKKGGKLSEKLLNNNNSTNTASKSMSIPLSNKSPIKSFKKLDNDRLDVNGNTIKKGNNKNYKVTFIDQVPSDSIIRKKGNLINYVNVESYKCFNVDVSNMRKSGFKKCLAKCTIY
jgi:hypothetical protein